MMPAHSAGGVAFPAALGLAFGKAAPSRQLVHIPRTLTRNAQRSAASSMSFEVGLPAP
jgi:hypothetical protein